ncbi:MAG TPA: hypothetical protein VLG46_14980 [Anaerolineae bacterium]|nr:hypothetical protein [Anaerolineae bacterium]
MAGLAHVGVGLAAKRFAPRVPVGILLIGAYAIDIVWGIFFAAGVEHFGATTTNPWSHGLFMALLWSGIAAFIAQRCCHNWRTSVIIGLVVFSHWVVDFISHPMTAVFPGDAGLPLFFEGSPTVGLGVWSTQLGVNIGEYGTFMAGLVIYLWTRRRLQKEKKLHVPA